MSKCMKENDSPWMARRVSAAGGGGGGGGGGGPSRALCQPKGGQLLAQLSAGFNCGND